MKTKDYDEEIERNLADIHYQKEKDWQRFEEEMEEEEIEDEEEDKTEEDAD